MGVLSHVSVTPRDTDFLELLCWTRFTDQPYREGSVLQDLVLGSRECGDITTSLCRPQLGRYP